MKLLAKQFQDDRAREAQNTNRDYPIRNNAWPWLLSHAVAEDL